MLIAALRDLQWRRRRFAIAIGGTALVFGMTLVMTGISHGFDAEAARTVDQLGVDGWVVQTGAAGPFLGGAPMPDVRAAEIAAVPGVEQAVPSVFTRKSVRGQNGSDTDVNVFGAPTGAPGMPATSEGSPPDTDGEVAISTALHGYDIGDRIELAGAEFTVVGKVSGSTALAGTPNVFLTLHDAQRVAFAGQLIASAIAIRGTPQVLPDGYVFVDRRGAAEDLLRAVEKARSSLTLTSVLLWVVAASIIGAVVYLSALERQRDFAVFKATGVSTGAILGGLVLQASVMALLAAVLGSVIGSVLGPRFPMLVSIEARAHLLLPLVAVLIGVVASLAGLRRAVTVDPALAFGGA
jgi:putative ABC transport system permease protein